MLSAPCPACGDRSAKRVLPEMTAVTTAPRQRHTGAAVVLCVVFPPLFLVWMVVAIVRLFAGRQPLPVVRTTPERHQCVACGQVLAVLR